MIQLVRCCVWTVDEQWMLPFLANILQQVFIARMQDMQISEVELVQFSHQITIERWRFWAFNQATGGVEWRQANASAICTNLSGDSLGYFNGKAGAVFD